MLAYCGNASVLKLQFLDVGHPEYSSLVDQFTSKWQHTKPVAGVEVVDVIKIEVGSFPVCNRWRSSRQEREGSGEGVALFVRHVSAGWIVSRMPRRHSL